MSLLNQRHLLMVFHSTHEMLLLTSLHSCTFCLGLLVVHPIVGSMLGGKEVLIQGPCFKDKAEIVCKFDDIEVPGTLLSNTTASCITPTLFRVGRVPFTVSFDNGNSFDFQGIFTLGELLYSL